jgi:hypothetical protein
MMTSRQKTGKSVTFFLQCIGPSCFWPLTAAPKKYLMCPASAVRVIIITVRCQERLLLYMFSLFPSNFSPQVSIYVCPVQSMKAWIN